MKKILFYFALLCFLLALATQILTYANIAIHERVPFVWALHLGIFIVLIPVIVMSYQNKKAQERRPTDPLLQTKQSSGMQGLLKESPRWMSIAVAGLMIASAVTFYSCISAMGGTPEIKDGEYILQDHGSLVRKITEEEYHHHMDLVLRLFSAGWLPFYGMGVAALFPFSGWRKQKGEQQDEFRGT
jgi:hypothetical protein